MGFRFRKSIKVLPGVRLNLSKRGIGTSVGVKGLHVSTGPSGPRVSASIPGTGIYASKSLKRKKSSTGQANYAVQDKYSYPPKIRGPYYVKPWRAILGILMLLTTFAALSAGLDLPGTVVMTGIFLALTIWLLFPWVKGIIALISKSSSKVNAPPEGIDGTSTNIEE